jgi:betaine-aldehyde dehydrogenase
MELGGKSPLIVFADAHLDNAVSASLLANFYTQGEICTNGTRVFVERKLVGAFLDRLVERARRLRIGDPMNPETEIGALISAAHRDRVLSYIDAGKKAGARLLCGGGAPDDPALKDGYFVLPTIFADCADEMAIVREEIFGPVMAVLAFDDEAEVVRRANDTEFGLAAGVWTHDIRRAHKMARALESGTVWINTYRALTFNSPFGGYKASGIGRQNGLEAVYQYLQTKSVWCELGDEVQDPFIMKV